MARSTAAMNPAAFATFGDLLRYLRRRQRLTQIDLAIATGYSTSQISRLEQNHRLPNPSTLHALFVPALGIEDEPDLVARLLDLALAAHGRQPADEHLPESDAATVPLLAEQEPVNAPSALNPLDVTSGHQAPLPGGQVLITKLFVPRPRLNRVARPRLLQRLDAALSVPLTLVSAPAGSGKTSLLADLLARWSGSRAPGAAPAEPDPHTPGRCAVAWLALDDGDNDPTTFLRYLIAAFQTLAPTVGSTVLTLLQAPQPPAPETLVRLLLNDLAALPRESLLVLDDYHLINAPAIHSALAVLLERLPPALHLVLATRADPPLPVSRLRARGQLVELRAADLRFTPDEAASFLTEVMGLPLSGADIAALETRTEGWIAGLQLAALAMQDRGDLPAFISAFTGSNRFIVAYLAEEVFERQPPYLQAFLLQTSILDRLCGPLCDAVMGIEDQVERGRDRGRESAPVHPHAAYTQALLEELERANLFLVPLDDKRRWYRYHHLFGEVLHERLRIGATVDDVAALHERASAWYEGQDLVVEAIQHALAGHAWRRAARVIEEHGLLLMMRGQVNTGLDWLNRLPATVMQEHPLVCIVHAIGLMLVNQADAAEACLQDAERSLQPDTPDELVRVVQGSVAGVRGRILYFAGDLERAIRSLQHALELLPETTTNVAAGRMSAMARAAWGVYVVTAYQLTGDVTAARERQAVDRIAPVRAVGHLMAALNSYTSLAALQVLQGRLRTAAATYAEVDRLVPGEDALHTLVGSPSYYLGMGDLLREWDSLDDAERYLQRGMELVHGTLATEGEVILFGYLTLARVQQARGNGAVALKTLGAFMQVARERKLFHVLIERAAAMQARINLMQGRLPPALRWAEGSGLHPDDAITFQREPVYLTLARVRIAAGQAPDIVPLLERLLVDAIAKARMHSAIEILTLQALAYDALDDRQSALMTLEQALALAEPEGYVRIFVDEGAPLMHLLSAVSQRPSNGRYGPYIETLLAALGVVVNVSRTPNPTSPIQQRVEPPSERFE